MDDKTRRTCQSILAYCARIEDVMARLVPTRETFDEETFYRDGLAFYIQQIGELMKGLPREFVDRHPEVKWHQVIGFRNIIAHAYSSIDNTILWDSLTIDIPELKSSIEKMLD